MPSSWSASLAIYWWAPVASASTPHSSVRLEIIMNTKSTGTDDCCLSTDPMQLVDELNMIYTTCLMCYATFSYSRSRQFALLLALGLISLAIFITLYYHYLQDPVFHQIAYAILTAIVLFRSMYVMEFTLRPSLTKKEEEWKIQRKRSMTADEKADLRADDSRDRNILRTMWVMIASGLSAFLFGFLLWNLDNKYCTEVRRWRKEIGLPWGVLLEGHGWWYDDDHRSLLDFVGDADS